MSKAVEANSPKSALVRVAMVVGAIGLLIGAVFLINLVMRGTGENERRIAEALMASIGQDNLSAEFDVSQQAQVQSTSVKGSVRLRDHTLYSGEASISTGSEEAKTNIPLKIAGDTENSLLFVHLSNASQVVDMVGVQAGEMKPMLDSIAEKINDKWLRIPQQTSEVTDCTGQLMSVLAADKDAQKQATDAYIANRFVVVREVQEKGENTVYTVTTDKGAMRGFFSSLKSKEFFKKQDACNASYDPLGLDAPKQPAQQGATQQPNTQQAAPATLHISVNKKGLISKIASVQRASDGVLSASVDLGYRKEEKIELPSENIVEFASISGEVQQVVGAMSQQQQMLNQQQGSSMAR